MLLTLIVLALVAVIAFFHYVQGFFSATLSAIIAVVAATVAFGYHEPLVNMLGGRFPDFADAAVLGGVFAIVYGLLRFLFDKYIPGNVMFPLMVDKIGAAVMGLVAAVFSVGIAIIAAQTLPFGPSIAGYSRYALTETANMTVANKREEAPAYSMLKNENFNTPASDVFLNGKGEPSHLLLPVDDWVVNTVGHLSAGGSLAAEQPLAAVHPAYLDELFFQRLGVQTGAKHVAINGAAGNQASVKFPLYSPPVLQVKDSEPARPVKLVYPKQLQSKPDLMLLIVRVSLEGEAADTDGLTRIGAAGIRLMTNGKNFIPIGTLDQTPGQSPVVLLNKADDFIVAPAGAAIDFVFQIPQADLAPNFNPTKGPMKVESEAFLEIKRSGFVAMTGQEIKKDIPPAPEKSPFRKYLKKEAPPVISRGGDASAAPAATDAPIEAVQPPHADSNFITPVSVGAINSDSQDVTFAAGTATLRNKKFAKLEIQPGPAFTALGQGDNPIRELAAPDGSKVVQISASTIAADRNKWRESLGQLELVDAAGKTYKVNGAWGKVKDGDGVDHLIAAYNADAPITKIPDSENPPSEIVLAFVVPNETKLTELRIAGKRVSAADLAVR